MAHDILFGDTSQTWSRGSTETKTPPSPTASSALTDKEKSNIEKLAELEMLATNGDVAAKKKIVEVNGALLQLQAKAKSGDAAAKRMLAALIERGLVVVSTEKTGQRLVMAGAYGPTRKPHQQKRVQGGDVAQQVQQFLVNLKIRAMAGDPQSIALLQQYSQLLSANTAPQSMVAPEMMSPPDGSYPPGAMPQADGGYPAVPPEGYPQQTTMAPVAGWSRPVLDAPIYTEKDRIKFLNNKYNFLPGQAQKEGWDPTSVKNMQQKAAKGDKQAVAYLTKLDTYIRDKNWTDDADPMGSNPHWAFMDDAGFNGHLAYIRGIGEEELALAREGGASERAALLRRL